MPTLSRPPLGSNPPIGRAALALLGSLTLAAFVRPQDDGAPFRLEDRFGRPLEGRSLTLVDWEGALANPRVELIVRPGDSIPASHYPLRVTLKSSSPRLLFDRFARLRPEGCSKSMFIDALGGEARFDLVVFGDEDGEDEQHELVVELEDALESPMVRSYPVHVVDRDVQREPGMSILIDYSFDETGFFQDERVRALTERAACELTDFLEDQSFAPVEPGSEVAFVWNVDGFKDGREVTLSAGYTGFAVVAHGIHHDGKHSGSCASDRRPDALQHRGDEVVGLRRSGTISMETSGNWNGLGWFFDDGSPDTWMHSRNLDAEPHDYLSIVRHELFHALVFHGAHPAFAALVQDGVLNDPALAAYLGRAPRLDASTHLADTVDPVSGFGAFGNEYGSRFPWRRWLVTKTDLLVLRAAGYRLRTHSALVPLGLSAPPEATAIVGAEFELLPALSGGVPDYQVCVASGALPEGLTLDSYTGRVHGVATTDGTLELVLEARDQDLSAAPVTTALRLLVVPPPTAPDAQPEEPGESTPPEEKPADAGSSATPPGGASPAVEPPGDGPVADPPSDATVDPALGDQPPGELPPDKPPSDPPPGDKPPGETPPVDPPVGDGPAGDPPPEDGAGGGSGDALPPKVEPPADNPPPADDPPPGDGPPPEDGGGAEQNGGDTTGG